MLAIITSEPEFGHQEWSVITSPAHNKNSDEFICNTLPIASISPVLSTRLAPNVGTYSRVHTGNFPLDL